MAAGDILGQKPLGELLSAMGKLNEIKVVLIKLINFFKKESVFGEGEKRENSHFCSPEQSPELLPRAQQTPKKSEYCMQQVVLDKTRFVCPAILTLFRGSPVPAALPLLHL